MRQWLVALIAAGLLLLFAVPTAAAADCALDSGFATLKALIEAAEGPDKVGACLEKPHVNPENGDVLQQTTGGLLVQRAADNRAAFTDGYRTWIEGPSGLQVRLNTEQFDWEGQPDLGTVTVAPGEAIQIRSMTSLNRQSSTPSQRGVALAIADYGPIKGHAVSMGSRPRLRLHRRGGPHRCRVRSSRSTAGRGGHRHFLLRRCRCRGADYQQGRAGDDLSLQHRALAHLRPPR